MRSRTAKLTFAALLVAFMPLFGANKLKVVVKNITLGARIDPNIQEILNSEFESKLAEIKKFEFIDRSQVKTMLEESALAESGLSCEDDKCNIRYAVKLKAQIVVSAKLFRLSDVNHKLSVKFLNVEKGTPEIIDARVEKLEEIDKAVAKVIKEFSDRVPLYGQLIKIDGGRVFVNLGGEDSLENDQEIEIIRLDAVMNDATGELAGYTEDKIAKGKLTRVTGTLSQILFTEKKKTQEQVADMVKLGDRVYVVVSEETKRRLGGKNYDEAQVFFKNKNYEEAKNSVDRALGYLPRSESYLNFRAKIIAEIDKDNLRVADQKEKDRIKAEAEERKLREAEERRKSTSSRSSYSYSSSGPSLRFGSSKSTFDRGAIFGGYTYLNPLSTTTDFGKYFSQLMGVTAGISTPKNTFWFWGNFYFFGNEVKKGVTAFDNSRAFAFDLHSMFNLSFPMGPFVPHVGFGAFYRLFTVQITDPSIPLQGNVFETSYWGIGWEPMAGVTIDLGGVGLDINVSYQIINVNTFELDDSGTVGTRLSALNKLSELPKNNKLSIGGFTANANLIFRIR